MTCFQNAKLSLISLNPKYIYTRLRTIASKANEKTGGSKGRYIPLGVEAMEQTTLESLDKRVAALEKGMAQVMQTQSLPGAWKDWRQAVGKVTRTELAEEVDAAARETRAADRRQAGS